MPELGATRIYVGDDHWQDLIKDLLSDRGALAVFQAGGTQGLRWELETVAAMLRPEQILMFLPFGLHWSRRRRDARYAAFHAWAGPCFPAPLPDIVEADEFFCYFTSRPAWKTRVLRPGIRPPERHPLTAVLTDLQKGKGLRRWTLFNFRRLCLLMLVGIPLGLVSVGFQYCAVHAGAGSSSAAPATMSAPNPKPPDVVAAPAIPSKDIAPPGGMVHVGKAFPYRLVLGPGWKEVRDDNPQVDLSLEYGKSSSSW